jgi:integrase
MAKLTKTTTPGIFRRHVAGCDGEGRCDCSYVVVWRHRGRQHKETHRTYGEAREAKGRREAGEKRPTSRVGFAEYFEEWIESYAGRTARGFSETSRSEYRRAMESHVLPKWRGRKLADVDPADIRGLFRSLRDEDKSTSEIKKARATLSAMFATAAEDRVLRSNPVQGVRIPASRTEAELGEARKALTRRELGLVLAAIPEDWRLFFELLSHTGLRISEAVGLTWEHLELGDSPRIKVREQVYRGKRRKLKSGAARRDIPLSPQMSDRLLAHRRDSYAGPGEPVFRSPTGVPLSPPNIGREVLHPARKAIGMPWVTFHTFRHTCASLLFEAGRNVRQVSEWLGHSDPAFCLRTYIDLMDDGIGDAGFLDAAVVPAGGNTKATGRTETAATETAVETADLAS